MIRVKAFLATALLVLPVLTIALPLQREEATARDLEDMFTREFLEQGLLEERGSFRKAFKKAVNKLTSSPVVKQVAKGALNTLAKSIHPREVEQLDVRDDMLYERDWENLEELD